MLGGLCQCVVMEGGAVLWDFRGSVWVDWVKIGLGEVVLSLLFFLMGFKFGCILYMAYIVLAPFFVMVGFSVNSLFWWVYLCQSIVLVGFCNFHLCFWKSCS